MADTKKDQRTISDKIVSILIPLALLGFACYQIVTVGDISQLLLAALVILTLAAAGNRFDGVISNFISTSQASKKKNDE